MQVMLRLDESRACHPDLDRRYAGVRIRRKRVGSTCRTRRGRESDDIDVHIIYAPHEADVSLSND